MDALPEGLEAVAFKYQGQHDDKPYQRRVKPEDVTGTGDGFIKVSSSVKFVDGKAITRGEGKFFLSRVDSKCGIAFIMSGEMAKKMLAGG